MPDLNSPIHPDLVAILDARAGKVHSSTGPVVTALAEILGRHLELLAAAGRLLPEGRLAEAILIAHQRLDYRSCLCGWGELGRSHPAHQVAMLREAALLNDTPLEEAADAAG